MSLQKEDRDEIRIMLHEVIDPWQKEVEKRDKLINIALNNIDSHLDKLNGKVAEHEKAINIHLPHTIQHCPQVELINRLEQDRLTRQSLKNIVVTIIGSFAGLLTVAWLIFKLFIEKSA